MRLFSYNYTLMFIVILHNLYIHHVRSMQPRNIAYAILVVIQSRTLSVCYLHTICRQCLCFLVRDLLNFALKLCYTIE
jgi:hypothetical protein